MKILKEMFKNLWRLVLRRLWRRFVQGDSFQGFKGLPGRARGKVVRVLNKKDLAKVTQGCIMVLNTLSHQLIWNVPARPGGVISNKGEPLAHAGIILFENDIPLVVGVKIGGLKDGDEVEIDGDQARVTLLSHE